MCCWNRVLQLLSYLNVRLQRAIPNFEIPETTITLEESGISHQASPQTAGAKLQKLSVIARVCCPDGVIDVVLSENFNTPTGT